MTERLTTDWRDLGLCRQVGGDDFFPERGGSTRAAKAVCNRCEVRPECGQHALDTGEIHGIWGGLTERERRKLRKAS